MIFSTNEINLPTLIILFTIVTSVSLEHNHLINILELRDNLFYVINESVHKVINKLFSVLKLKSDFLKSSKVHLLLTMHSDLNNIALKNFNIYQEFKNISRVENFTMVNDDVLRLKSIIDSVMKKYENEIRIKNHTEDKSNSTMASSSVESLDFIEELLSKINSLTVANFTVEQSNVTFDEETDIFSFVKENSSDLKIWNPPTNAEKEELFSNLTRRIYKGKITRIKKYPFVASIHLMNEFMCAGSIISRDIVITAASCLQIVYNNKKLRENPKSVFIRIGSDYTKRFGETIQIKELYFHPEYESFSLKNNLLLLRMAKKLKFIKKKRKIRRIQYDKNPQKLSDVDEITILGWGATDPTLGVKTYQPLAVSDIDVYDFDKCQEIYSMNYVTEKNFCVGFVSEGGGACKGDVGGPGVANGVLMGVISFGPPVCGAIDMPTVLVKLGYYAQWIESVIHQQPTATRPPNFITSAPIKPTLRTTSTKRIHESYPQNSNYPRTGMAKDYPEEIAVLNQMFNEVILSNKTLIDDLLYGALEDDFSDIFKSSPKQNIYEHPLVNKSLFLLPEIHDFGVEEQTTVTEPLTTSSTDRTTRHPDLNVHYLDDYRERINYMEAAHKYITPHQPLATRTPSTTKEPRHITDRFGRSRKITPLDLHDESEYSKVVSSEDSEKISDNYESNKEDDESKGISIEVTKLKEEYFVSEETTKPSTRRSTKQVAVISSKEEIEYKPKKIKMKTTGSSKIPFTSRRTRFIKNSKAHLYGHIYEHVRSVTKNKHTGKHKKIYDYY